LCPSEWRRRFGNGCAADAGFDVHSTHDEGWSAHLRCVPFDITISFFRGAAFEETIDQMTVAGRMQRIEPPPLFLAAPDIRADR
jgi:hypothetical protein